MSLELRFLEVGEQRIAYRQREGSGPTLVFLPGYASDMEGAKALALDSFAERRGLAMLRLDYSGTGSSGGKFEDGTLDIWLAEALAAIDQLTRGAVILIGSSMGGWIVLHLALLRLERVNGLIGIAAAPDFTDWGFSAKVAAHLTESSKPTHAFWQSGQELLLLNRDIAITCPVRLIHGEKDQDVPLEIAFRTMQALRSADVQLTVVKGGGHRLSEPSEIDLILRTLAGLLEPAP